MQRNHQNGSAHVIIIVFLVVALLVTLGFVFYQNFIAKKPEVPMQQPAVVEDTSTTVQLAFNSDIYELTYPKKWEVKTEKQENALNNRAIFTSPSGKVVVTFSVAEGGVGGTCDTKSPLKVRYYNVRTQAVKKLGTTPAYMIEAMTDAEGGGYNYTVGLTEDGGNTHTAVGASHCTVTYVGLAEHIIIDSQKNIITQPTIFGKVTFPKTADENGKVKEMQPIKDILATDEYNEAVTILESAHKK